MGKLVRDKISDLIRASGQHPRVKTLNTGAYREALVDKLREEVAELAAEQTSKRVLAEAADLLEVIASISERVGNPCAAGGLAQSPKCLPR